jgi:Dolichyl-phosphate-mannose-protein mannosyltransferase
MNATDGDERTRVRRLAFPLVLFTLVVYGRAFVHSRGAFGDAFHHLMNGIFVFDLLREPAAALSDPLGYATSYYRHFPAMSIGYYPPVFPVIEAALMGVFGVSATTGQLTVLLMAVPLALFSFAWFRLRADPWTAAGGAALLVTAPSLVYWGRDIMLEVPVVAFMVGALWLFERLLASDRPSWALAVGWAALAALAMWTKQHAVFLVGVFALSALGHAGATCCGSPPSSPRPGSSSWPQPSSSRGTSRWAGCRCSKPWAGATCRASRGSPWSAGSFTLGNCPGSSASRCSCRRPWARRGSC